MKQMVDEIFDCCGSEARVLTADGEIAVRAFIRPITAHSLEQIHRNVHTLGRLPKGRYVYLGPAEPFAREDTVILSGGKRLLVCRMERMLYEDRVIYTWGILRETGGNGGCEG